MTLYQSKTRYEILEAVPENAEALAAWGLVIDEMTGIPAGYIAVRTIDSDMVAAIVTRAVFKTQFEIAT